jgi:outer membrane protein TolC
MNKSITIFVAAAALCASVCAQEPAALSLDECLNTARSRNRVIIRRGHELDRAVLQRDIAETEVFLPTLTAQAHTSDENESNGADINIEFDGVHGFRIEPFIALDRDNAAGEDRTTEVGVKISRQLLRLNEHIRQKLPITRADKDILVAENRLRLELRTIDLAVTRAFYSVQRALARLAVRRTRVEDSREFLGITERRVMSGFAAPVDQVNATINLSSAQADLVTEESNVESTLDQLKEVMGLRLEALVRIKEVALDTEVDWAYDLARDADHLRADHEELVNERLELDVQDHDIQVQADAVRPDLELAFTAQRRGEGESYFGSRDEDTEEVRLELTYSTTLDFEKADRARLKQQRIERQERELQLTDAEIRLGRSLRDAARTIDRSKIQIGLNRTRLEAEREKLEATIARYDRGNVDNLEVTRAKQTVDNAAIQLLESQINLILAIAQYRSLLP